MLGSLYTPFCVSNTLHNRIQPSLNLFKSSTLGDLNIAELLAEAEQSPFGKGTQTVIYTSVRNSVEISADKLNQATLSSLKEAFDLIRFASRMQLEVRPYKLVIYQEGGFFSEHRDSVRGENHIGTLVYILNSEFTGGELVVRQNEVEKRIAEPHEWIAMYGDCPHRIEPVTSGTRVSLIFDLYNVGPICAREYFEQQGDAGSMCYADDGQQLAPDAAKCAAIISSVDAHFAKFDTVVVCLTHLYPMCQTNPACLKGGDVSLFTILHDANKYDLSVIPISIEHEVDAEYVPHSSITANLIDMEFESCPRTKKRADKEKVVLIIPTCCDSGQVLSRQEQIDHVGNSAQNEETQYLTTGLRVTKRAE